MIHQHMIEQFNFIINAQLQYTKLMTCGNVHLISSCVIHAIPHHLGGKEKSGAIWPDIFLPNIEANVAI